MQLLLTSRFIDLSRWCAPALYSQIKYSLYAKSPFGSRPGHESPLVSFFPLLAFYASEYLCPATLTFAIFVLFFQPSPFSGISGIPAFSPYLHKPSRNAQKSTPTLIHFKTCGVGAHPHPVIAFPPISLYADAPFDSGAGHGAWL